MPKSHPFGNDMILLLLLLHPSACPQTATRAHRIPFRPLPRLRVIQTHCP